MARTAVRFILSFLFFAFLLFTRVYPQIPTENPPIADTTGYYQEDTLQFRPSPPLKMIGSLDRTVPVCIRDSVIYFSNYRSVPDILSSYPGIFTREFGGLGHIPSISLNGNSARQFQFANDGIGLNDPWTGQYNLYFYPSENIGQVEIIDGTRAFLYGFNSTGGVVNFVSKSKRAMKPYSRLRYSESGYGLSIVDGMLSQNITKSLNVTAGVQHTVFGERFTNEKFDAWNGRLKLRYDISDKIGLFMTEIYNQTYLGLNGGIDRNATPDSLRYDNLQATVRNSDAYEKVKRHDFQVGAAAFPFSDSAAFTTLTLYYSSILREYRDEENRYPGNGVFIQQNQGTNWMGLKILSNLLLGPNHLTLGWDVQSQNPYINTYDSRERTTLMSTFGKIEIPLIDFLSISTYAKLDSYEGERPLSFGGDINLKPFNGFIFFGGYSRSFRFPSFLERHGLDTIITSSFSDTKPERNHLAEAGMRWSDSDWLKINLRSFYRITWNPVAIEKTDYSVIPYAYVRHSKRTAEGITCGLTLQTGVLVVEGSARYIKERDEQLREKISPEWSADGGIYYNDNLFRDHLGIKAGIHATAFGAYRGYEFNDQISDFLPTDAYYEIGPNSIFDLVILAHIGDAYLHLILDNILNTHLVMNNFYPLHERRLRFGVSWEFLD